MRTQYQFNFRKPYYSNSHFLKPVLISGSALSITLIAMTLGGCGRTSPEEANSSSGKTAPVNPTNSAPETGNANASGDFKAALITSGPTSDNGWNADAYKAFQSVKKEMNLSDTNAASEENRTSSSLQDESLRSYASQKFNVIFAHGHEYQDLALKMEKEYPKTLFVVSSGEKIGTNTTPISLKLEDGAYLEGMLAAGMSKSHIIASVGAEKIPPVESVFQAFEKGAKAVDPNVKVLLPAYTGSWDDPKKAKDQTLAMLSQNADVIMQDVDAAASGVFKAVSESSKPDKPVYALGTNSDQNMAAPDVILASAPIYFDKVFLDIAKQVKAGTYKPTAAIFDLKSGIIGFVINPKIEAKIPAALKQKIEDARKKILDGSLVVPKAG